MSELFSARGCRFRLVFAGATTLARLAFHKPSYNRMQSRPIRLIDDDEFLTTLLEESLRREGYDPESCGDTVQAEEEMKRQSFDVILLDVMLPDRSGFEFCAELRNWGIQIPVRMPTARGDVTDRVKGLGIGADDYLPKPFEFLHFSTLFLPELCLLTGGVSDALFELLTAVWLIYGFFVELDEHTKPDRQHRACT